MIDLPQGLAVSVAHVPGAGVPSAASVTLVNAAGQTLATPTVTIDATGPLTVATVTSPRTCTFAAVTGLAVDRQYWWTSVRGGGALVRVSEIATLTVTLESAPPGTLRAGDTLRGVRCTATIPDTATATRGVHLLRWVTTIGGVVEGYTETAYVVRQRFAPPVTSSDVARYVQRMWPSAVPVGVDGGYWRELARRANARVLESAIQQERYPHLSGDHSLWSRAGAAAMRWELAQEGLVPPGEETSTYRRDQERELEDAIRQAVTGAVFLPDDTAVIDPNETQAAGSRRIRRVS
jgi:hypothetical protein